MTNRYVPTLDAIEAAGEACQKFFKHHDEHPIQMNDGEFRVHTFNAGFHRGIEWFQKKSVMGIDASVPNSRPGIK